MLLNEIKGIEHYLLNNCYCRYEIYDSSGFFYQIFKPEDTCKLLGSTEYNHFVIVKDQLIIFYISDKEVTKILDATRYDATENNIKIAKLLIEGMSIPELKEKGHKLDIFPENDTARSLEQILSMADAVMIGGK